MEGLLIINKEAGFTSFDVVAKLRGILGEKKIGHLGTLDPEAEGVLPVLIGRATRLAPLLSEGGKVYRATMLLGITTDSQDTTGHLLERSEVPQDEALIRETVLSFIGEQNQLPPMVSAKKIDGKKLVDLAREGKDIERKACRITVDAIEILSISLPRVTMRIRCSKGTYIRTLCHDIGERLGCGACLEYLLREEASGYRLEDALKLDEVTSLELTGDLASHMRSLKQLLDGFPKYSCGPDERRLAVNGNPIPIKWLPETLRFESRPVHVISSSGDTIGLFQREERKEVLCPTVMLGREPAASPARRKAASVVSLGKFDGVHLGHQAILSEMEKQAQEYDLQSALLSFTNQPESVTGARRDELLIPTAEKRMLLKQCGIRKIVEARFMPQVREMPADRFLKNVLIEKLGMRRIVVGPDCSFGKDRIGNVVFLLDRAEEYGYSVTVVEKVRIGGEIVSSTRIKKLIREGRMEEAAACLGRDYSISGRVRYGKGLGRELGFPTLNILPGPEQVLPPFGVYSVRCRIGEEVYAGIANLGLRPTVEDTVSPLLEVHLPNLSGNWYGAFCQVQLLSFIRPETQFLSLPALQSQIMQDMAEAKKYLYKSEDL